MNHYSTQIETFQNISAGYSYVHINSTSTRMSIKLMGARDPEEISDVFRSEV